MEKFNNIAFTQRKREIYREVCGIFISSKLKYKLFLADGNKNLCQKKF